jgi:hypothetical protein
MEEEKTKGGITMAKGPNTSIGGMHDILFQQLERISNEDLKGEDLEMEMKRTDAICDLAGKIIDNGHLAIKVAKIRQDAATMAPEVGYLVEMKD